MVTVPTFDFISVQIYESFSHADFNLTVLHSAPADYLYAWVPRFAQGWTVDFSSDPDSAWPTQTVSLPYDRLVIGLANGWAGSPQAVLVMPQDVGVAHERLAKEGRAPRGYVFWNIGSEGVVPANGTQPLYMAAEINTFLHTRP